MKSTLILFAMVTMVTLSSGCATHHARVDHRMDRRADRYERRADRRDYRWDRRTDRHERLAEGYGYRPYSYRHYPDW